MEKEELKEIADLAKVNSETLAKVRELTEIQVLSEIKKKIARWAQTWAIGLTVAFSILTIFGIDQLVLHRVNSEVNERLDNLNNALLEAEFKMSKKTVLFDKMLSDLENSNENAKSLIARVIKTRDNLVKLERSIKPTWTKLSEINKEGKLIIVLRKLVDDFFTIKNVEILVRVNFSVDIEKLADNLGFRTNNFAFGVDLQESLKSNKSHAQFYPKKSTVTHLKETGRDYHDAISYRAIMYLPFEGKLYGKYINYFKFRAIQFRSEALNSEPRARALAEAFNKITHIDCTVYLNRVPILRKKFQSVEFMANKFSSGEKYHAMAVQEFQEGASDMRKAYENAFSDR